jgi:3-hydroxymyristoyl/3-hydroxydecanoyl-(acyl carrier protein) dehydratase
VLIEDSISSDHPVLKDHFPNGAVIPGVVLLDRIEKAIRREFRDAPIVSTKRLRFSAPAIPDHTFSIEIIQKSVAEFQVKVHQQDQIVLSGKVFQ